MKKEGRKKIKKEIGESGQKKEIRRNIETRNKERNGKRRIDRK